MLELGSRICLDNLAINGGDDMGWKLAEAKNKLSELLDRAEHEGPQEIHRRNKVFVIVERDEYLRERTPAPTFKDWLLNGPDLSDLDLSRDKSPMRAVDL